MLCFSIKMAHGPIYGSRCIVEWDRVFINDHFFTASNAILAERGRTIREGVLIEGSVLSEGVR